SVSFRFTLCMSRQRDSMGPGILLLATTVLLLSVSVGAMVSASVVEGMRMTCPIRKFSALSPGLASQMALADTLYFTVSRQRVSPNAMVWYVSFCALSALWGIRS